MKKSRSFVAIAATAALTFFALPAAAQDDEGGPITQGEDAHYVSVTYVKFHTGKRERAMEIISEHFVPASEKAGLAGPLGTIHFQTGEWDMLVAWDLDGGMADLEWYRSEDDIKWWNSLVEQEGGEEAADALMGEYLSLIDEAETDVGHYHAPMEDE